MPPPPPRRPRLDEARAIAVEYGVDDNSGSAQIRELTEAYVVRGLWPNEWMDRTPFLWGRANLTMPGNLEQALAVASDLTNVLAVLQISRMFIAEMSKYDNFGKNTTWYNRDRIVFRRYKYNAESSMRAHRLLNGVLVDRIDYRLEGGDMGEYYASVREIQETKYISTFGYMPIVERVRNDSDDGYSAAFGLFCPWI